MELQAVFCQKKKKSDCRDCAHWVPSWRCYRIMFWLIDWCLTTLSTPLCYLVGVSLYCWRIQSARREPSTYSRKTDHPCQLRLGSHELFLFRWAWFSFIKFVIQIDIFLWISLYFIWLIDIVLNVFNQL